MNVLDINRYAKKKRDIEGACRNEVNIKLMEKLKLID
jgi:hypothetical protein